MAGARFGVLFAGQLLEDADQYLPDENYRGFAFHLRKGALSAEEQVEPICRVLGIERGRIAGISRVANQLPTLLARHDSLIEKVDEALAGSRLAITGNWFPGVSITDCLTRSHQEFERLFAG